MQSPSFWSNPTSAQALIRELKALKSTTDPYASLKQDLSDAIELLGLAEDGDLSIIEEIEWYIIEYDKRLLSLEVRTFFSKEEDSRDALLSIHSGAGGVDSMDWAAQIERMYQRWLTKAGFEWAIEDRAEGEAGIKRSVMVVHGLYAYGHLKSEIGVHRICHVSKFDANHKKQTSFASVDVIPIYEKVNVEIKESDLEVETMRSGGPGGQGVQTTDSAVRVRHKPTGLFVKCQASRSQIQNKKKAVQLLNSKLQAIEDEKKGIIEKPDASFGHQIRTYAYTLVTDHRTGLQAGNVNGILDGDLTPLIEAYLRFNARSKKQ
jgi:peptide chain release factor 2